MINVLPIEDRKEIKKEYFKRLIVVSLALLAAVLAMATIMLLPTMIFLSDHEQIHQQEMEYIDAKLKSSGIATIKPLVDDLNKKISILNETSGFQSASRTAGEIMSLGLSGISIKSFSIKIEGDKETISITGQSATRRDLLSFVENLKKCKAGFAMRECIAFENVISPVSNILKDKDIAFSITADVFSKTNAKPK